MAIPYAVEVLEQCWIAPPPGSVPTTSLPLSYFDIPWLTLPTVQRLFFYEVDHSKAHFLNTVLPNLKHSLSLTLQHFFPLAGSLTWPHGSPKPIIDFVNGKSVVSLTVAQSDYNFHDLSGNNPKDASLSYPLVPELSPTSGSDTDNKSFAVFALQITLFPNKGVSIGITYHHTVADGRILIHFIRSWASVCRSHGDTALFIESPIFHDRTMVNDTKGIDMLTIELLKNFNITRETFSIPRNSTTPMDKVLGTFVLSRSDIMRIKNWVLKSLENEEKLEEALSFSTFVITCAYVWVCLIKARRGESAVNAIKDAKEVFCFAVDCRTRLDPPLPLTYFGNCLRGAMVTAEANELTRGNGIAIAAERIARVIPTIKGSQGFIKDIEAYALLDVFSTPERCLSVAGSTKLGIYETDFGWGIPKRTEVVSIATTGAISLSEHPLETGAVEVGVVRDKIQMEAFTSLFADTLKALPQLEDDC